MPSTTMLVAAMNLRLEALGRGKVDGWSNHFDAAHAATRDEAPNPAIAGEYQTLFANQDLFPSPVHRQRFISESMQWASNRQPPVSEVSLLLASILTNGANRRAPDRSGAKAGNSSPIPRSDLGGWVAHTLYTTNFDEVMPQTFRLCGEPVIVVDHPEAHGRLHGDARHPRVAYLHGCHLHYSLRNTPAELERPDTDRSGGVDLAGLFLRFRDTLRSTGLIVLGYSGWKDRAVMAIRDALADSESLPYGLYWGARFGERSLSDDARSLLRDHSERACMLDEGRDVKQTLSTLCSELCVDHHSNLSQWSKRIEIVQRQLTSLMPTEAAAPAVQPAAEATPAPTTNVPPDPTVESPAALRQTLSISKLLVEARELNNQFTRDAASSWLGRAQGALAEAPAKGDRDNADLHYWIGDFRYMLGQSPLALEALETSIRQFEEAGEKLSACYSESRLLDVLLFLARYEEAERRGRAVVSKLLDFAEADAAVRALVKVSRARFSLGRLNEAKEAIGQATDTIRGSNDAFTRGWVNEFAATLALEEDELEVADEKSKAAAKDYDAAPSPIDLANVERLQARIALARGVVAGARALAIGSGTRSASVGEKVGELESLILQAECDRKDQDHSTALQNLAAARKKLQEIDGLDPKEYDYILGAAEAECMAALGKRPNAPQAIAAIAAEVEKLGVHDTAIRLRLGYVRTLTLLKHPKAEAARADLIAKAEGLGFKLIARLARAVGAAG